MSSHSKVVAVFCEVDSNRAVYAVNLLFGGLPEYGYTVSPNSPGAAVRLALSADIKPEGFSLSQRADTVEIHAGDDRGLIYGVHSLLEILSEGLEIGSIPSRREEPKLSFRAIKYDLPWDTYRHSSALYQHQEICKQPEYWRSFLDMMSENRLNVLTLWNLHPYPYLIRPRNFPEASPWSEEEMVAWRELFSSIFSMADERGIETYLIPFNIFVSREFSLAYNAAMDNLDHHHFVNGDTSDLVKRYTRECVSQVLEEYPLLSGFGLTLGEGMGGMTPQEREDWIRETIIAGMRDSGRPVKLIHRIPFSGNTGSLGDTTIEMERVTRAGIEEEAGMDFIEGPVWAGMKFNWSHPLSTTSLIKVHGGKLYGTYFDPPPAGYKVVWTARNEDIFCLRWGDMNFIRSHITENSRDYVGGYFIGSETYIPAKDYFTRQFDSVPWNYAFERQWLYYVLWGRLLYDRETPDKVFLNAFRRRYGTAGDALFQAYNLASKTPIRLNFSFDTTWDFTLYAEGFMALDPDKPRVELISVERMIDHPPLDPRYVRIADFVEHSLAGGTYSRDRITPLAMAESLESDCGKALEVLATIDSSDDVSLAFEVADAKTWSHLGLYFAAKLRGGVAFQTFRSTNQSADLDSAVRYLTDALNEWDAVISLTRPIYNDMPLVHFSEQDGKSWQENDELRFHWSHLRSDVVDDLRYVQQYGRDK